MTERFWWSTAQSGITEAMNARGGEHGCRPLLWSVDMALNPDADSAVTFVLELTGMTSAECAADDVPGILAEWANLIGIEGDPQEGKPSPGALTYSSTYGGKYRQVTLWGIVDRDAWDAAEVARRAREEKS